MEQLWCVAEASFAVIAYLLFLQLSEAGVDRGPSEAPPGDQEAGELLGNFWI